MDKTDDKAYATGNKLVRRVLIYLKRTQLLRNVYSYIDVQGNARIWKITPYLLCSASKRSAVKRLAAAAKSISIISVFEFQTVENSFAGCSKLSYSLRILLDAQLTT